jgi:hypothetical protein
MTEVRNVEVLNTQTNETHKTSKRISDDIVDGKIWVKVEPNESFLENLRRKS